MARLLERYQSEIRPSLAKKLGRDNPMSLPRLKKIVVNMGVGSAVLDKKHLEEASGHLEQITGQKPMICRARVSIANFKLREGQAIGCKVTLRGKRMYEFLDQLLNLVLPRVRDFRGLEPNGFDGQGNYNMGLAEQLAFPQINPDKVTRPQGMTITCVTNVKNNDEARELLRELGFPFKADADAKGAVKAKKK